MLLPNLNLNLTYRCNSRCRFCAADVAFKEAPRGMTLQDLQHLLGPHRYRTIFFSGGEPTIHPQFFEIVELCSRKAEHLALLTHGRGLESMEFAEKVLGAGISSLVIPLYGDDPTSHDGVTQVKGSFRQTVKGFSNLAKLRGRYDFFCELKLLLTRYTAKLNPLIYRLAVRQFSEAVDQIGICPLIYSESLLESREEFSAPFRELEKSLLSLVKKISQEGRFRLRVNEFPPCFFKSPVLRRKVHPNLDRVVCTNGFYYGDMDNVERIAVREETGRFRKTAAGNQGVHCCRGCRHDPYCSVLHSPYFSQAYLDLFGEKEFSPISMRPGPARGLVQKSEEKEVLHGASH